MKGIDIAKWNPISDYAAVSRQVNFAIIKVINKSCNEDGLFSTHLKGCRDNNIPIFGVYNYSYTESIDKAKSDARAVISVLRKHNLNTIVWLDIEETEIAKRLKRSLILLIDAYRLEIESAGYKFGIYTGLSYYNTFLKPYIDKLNDIPFWIARYPSSSPMTVAQNPNPSKKPIVPNMVGWQYTSKGQVKGIKGNVDISEWYGYEAVDKSTEKVYPTLRKGDQNEYVRAWQTFLNLNGYDVGKAGADGIFGKDTEKAVYKYQKDHPECGTPDGVIGPKTWASLPII